MVLSTKFMVSKVQEINRIVKNYRDAGVLGRKKGTGRKRKTTPLQDRLIVQSAKRIAGALVRKLATHGAWDKFHKRL